jgi:hypothetical protein
VLNICEIVVARLGAAFATAMEIAKSAAVEVLMRGLQITCQKLRLE